MDEIRSRRAMNSPIDTPSTQQRGIRGVDDCIQREGSDVRLDRVDFHLPILAAKRLNRAPRLLDGVVLPTELCESKAADGAGSCEHQIEQTCLWAHQSAEITAPEKYNQRGR